MNKLQQLLNQLETDSIAYLEKRKVIFSIGDLGDKHAVPHLMQMLPNETNVSVRDALAMALGDLHAHEAVPMIVELIRQPGNENRRGSLIYALQGLDCAEHFLYFIELICTANFECRQMSLFLIEKYADSIDRSTKDKALELLSFYEDQLTKVDTVAERENKLDFIAGNYL